MTPGMKPKTAPLDPIVKIGLTVLLGGFLLIGGGMFLSRPDRSIPPFSIGAQQGTIVAIHVPSWTSDPEIESLIRRFRKVGEDYQDFRVMKIKPTTPTDPNGFYQEMTVYVFSDPTWTEPEVLAQYLRMEKTQEEQIKAKEFRAVARGGFVYKKGIKTGWLGPIPSTSEKSKEHNMQLLFNEASGGQE